MAVATDQHVTERGDLAVALEERLAALRADVMARHGAFLQDINPHARAVAQWRAWRPGMTVVEFRAKLLLELVKLSRLELGTGWRLAGNHLEGHPFGQEAFFQGGPERMVECGLSDEEIEEVLSQPYGHGPNLRTIGEADTPPMCSVYHGHGWLENHSIRDYPKVLRLGFAGILEEVEAHRAKAREDDPEFPRQEAFWRAARWVCEAGCLLGERHAALACAEAQTASGPEERARLEAMAEACRQVPARGARTLFEATQALWLAHVLTCGEDGINANSIGRLDQMLQPYYAADVAAGRVTREEAVDLMAELACKLYLDYEVQAITLGGVDASGADAANDMTRIILEATERVGFVRDLSVRLHPDTPDDIYLRSARLIARGGGIPFVFNDAAFIPALVEHGIAEEHARDYAPIGCIELTIPGKANPHAVSGWFNALKALELALFDGMDPRTGEQMGPHTGLLTGFADFDALMAAYRAQVAHFAARMVYHCNRGELRQQEAGPMPCWSVLTDDCIARGRDITDGGPLYNYHSICFLGTANVADSLCALRKLVFEEGRVAPDALLTALREDFADHEALRKMLLTGAPKYGNDCAEVDVLASEVANHFIDLMDEARSPLGGRYVVHLFSFLSNISFGEATGATPDGRHAADPLAYSLSAHQGRDQEGVTALLNSLARLPHHRAAGASAAIVDLDPALVKGEAGIARLAQTMKAAMRMGVGQLQFNVTTRERLLQAQEDPERYGNIPVRVAGYSQMFKLLTPELQAHVIARTKHTR